MGELAEMLEDEDRAMGITQSMGTVGDS